MARDCARRATACLREAELALQEGYPPLVIRRSQEALELATKALLRALGIEYPKRHDVSDVLLERREHLPEPVRSEVESLSNSPASGVLPSTALRRRGSPPREPLRWSTRKGFYRSL